MEITLDGPNQPPLSCGKPKYLVVLLHASGSTGDEVIELALDWAPTLNKGEFLAPNAPWFSEEGGSGRQWRSPAGQNVRDDDEIGECIQQFLDAVLAKRRLDDSQLALVGFAQGATVALRAGLLRARPLGAVVAIAGGLEMNPSEHLNIRSTSPVLLVEADIEAGAGTVSLDKAEQQLDSWGIPVQRVARPGNYHGLDDEGVSSVADYLHQALVRPSVA